ncbi:MAG: family transposase [Marmoricola sp.]|nr:family transposase [Marmoricola sp.]
MTGQRDITTSRSSTTTERCWPGDDCPRGLEGVTRLHSLIAAQLPDDWVDRDPDEAAGLVKVGIETDRGSWVGSLVAAGYEVFAINPLSVAHYRERHSTSGAKSDAADAHLLAEIVRLDRGHHRPVAEDSDLGEAIKLAARTHQSLIWDRSRHVARLRSTLREYFPAALLAFEDLDAPDVLELLSRAPDPDQAARLGKTVIVAALERARRRRVEDRTRQLRDIFRAPELRQPPALQSAYAAVVASEVAIITALNTQIDRLGAVVGEHFGRHRDAEIYLSQPGLGVILAARILGEFGDDPDRYADAKSRKNYAGTSPVTPKPLARRRSSWPATPATAGSAMPCSNGPSAHCADHREQRPTTSNSATARSATRPHYASSPTASSASCTAA